MGAQGKNTKHPLPAPAFWAALAFAAGIFISALTTNHLLFWFVFSALAGLCTAIFHFRPNPFAANFSVLILLAGLGGLRYSSAMVVVPGRSAANFAGFNKRMVISGRVCELPDVKPDRTLIYLDEIKVGWKEKFDLDGKIRLSIGQPVSSFAVEDRIEFVGLLDSLWQPANPVSLDFGRLMRIRGVETTIYLKDEKGISVAVRSSGGWRSHLSRFREKVEQKLTESLPARTSGVVKGFVLGITKDIEPSTYDLFRKTGTLHLLAVSGANVAWVALLPIYLLKLFHLPLRWRYGAALGVVWCFVLLTDLQASVLRAAIMFTVWTASRIIYREISGLQSLGLCALFLLCINPLWFFDIGFELSFLAVFALIFSFAEEEYEKSWAWRWFVRPFRANLKSSIAIFLLITPLLAYYFNQVAWTALLVNVAAMPLTAMITWSALMGLAFGFFDFFGPLFLVQEKLFEALFWVQNLFVSLPHTLLRVPHPNGLETLLLTVAGFGMLLFFFKPTHKKAGLYFFLLGLTPIIWGWSFQRPPTFSLAVLEAKEEMVAILSLRDRTVIIGGGEVHERQHTPHFVLEPFLAYLGNDKINGYLPLRFDSSGRAASLEIAQKYRPDFIGWPAVGQREEGGVGRMDIGFEYLQTVEDAVPFGLRLNKDGLTFLIIPQVKKSKSPRWDSLLAGPTVLVAPLDLAQAESLARYSNVQAVVSTRRDYRLPPMLSGKLFFTFRDGAITFRAKNEDWAVQTHISKRKLAFDNHR